MGQEYRTRFKATLFRYPGKGGWTFAPIPPRHAPSVTHAWGRTPVDAVVDGYKWRTSVWRGKSGTTLLAIPKRARGEKGHGDSVTVTLTGIGAPSARRQSRTTAAAVRRLALALPEAVEGTHLDQPDFRVRKRIFATLPKDGDTVCLKTSPSNLDALVSADPETYQDAWRGRWVRVRLDRVTQRMLRELLADAWRLAAPKRLAATLDSSDA